MLTDFKTMLNHYTMKINGVIHVGGYIGDDVEMYQDSKINKAVFFEPSPESFTLLEQKTNNIPNYISHNCAIGSTENYVSFNISNNQCSSSILEPKLHLTIHPQVQFTQKIQVPVKTLDSFNLNDYNFLNIDVQGYELEVLKGAKNTLQSVDYILSEINYQEVYENCALIQDIDSFLLDFNFKRVATFDGVSGYWGDALYIKQSKE